ncbi:Tissue inhibitor of metalloproteinase, partial [Trichostrongylus colubriformis]
MKVLLIIICTIAAAFGCRCRKLPSNEAFCNADWVSHVNVTNSSVVSSETEPERLLYTVTHVEVLKQPNETSSLPDTITTSTSSASCGVSLEMGKEYLLSGEALIHRA